MTGSIELLRERTGELSDLARASGLLDWDQQTMMPPQGAAGRAEGRATVERIPHELFISPETGPLPHEAGAGRAASDGRHTRRARGCRRRVGDPRHVRNRPPAPARVGDRTDDGLRPGGVADGRRGAPLRDLVRQPRRPDYDSLGRDEPRL